MDSYFWKQILGFSRDLQTKVAKIEKQTKDEFVLSDWSLNNLTREWTYSKDGSKVVLEKQESTFSSVLKDKLVQNAVTSYLPNDK